jgi:Holliday junction resolvase RusA-like endonuclease
MGRVVQLVLYEKCTKNERFRVKRNNRTRKMYVGNTDAYEAFCRYVATEWSQQGRPRIESGKWAIKITAFVDKQRHFDDGTSVPMIDNDAVVSAVFDALEACECIDDDMRFAETLLYKRYDKERPRIEIEAWEL